jgi:FkbM family methyltransferase
VLAGTEHNPVLERTINTIVDIGANRGQFALAARGALPDARIISFEPLPAPAATYRAVFAGDERVTLHQVAVGPTHERVPMNISARDDSSSLLRVSRLQTAHYPGTDTVATVEVLVCPLDEKVGRADLARPSLLKIDVQGAEWGTLLGCESLLDCFDLIYCECSFVELYCGQRLVAEILDWLSARGVGLVGFYNVDRDAEGHPLQADFLFRRRT